MTPLISPSILAADFLHLYDDIKRCEESGCDMIHCDVMDGVYVPNISFGFSVIAQIKKITSLPLDVHMMTCCPDKYINDLKNSGADIITVHSDFSCENRVKETLISIKESGLKAGVSLKPARDYSDIIPFEKYLDLILVMTVEPGFGGQKFMKNMMPKVHSIRELIDSLNRKIILSVDGGIDQNTIVEASSNGADCFAVGTCMFKSENMHEKCNELKELALNSYLSQSNI